MRKVIHLISTMNIGGAETMVKDYALLMDKTQFEVKIISIDKSYHSANEAALRKAEIPLIFLSELRYKEGTTLNILQKIHRFLARYHDLRKILKKEKPDVLHVHLGFDWYLRFLPLKKWNIKVLYTVHNIPESYFDITGKNRKKYQAYREIVRLLKKENLTLIALHDEMNLELRELFHTKNVVTVNNGVVLERFQRELYNRTEIRKSLGIKDNAWVIGHIGRFHEQKNHDLIFETFKKVLERRKDAFLLLVGEGPLRESFEKKIKQWGIENKVLILENRGDIPQLMCAMDVFFFPSRWEGFGNVLIEAQSIGLPCVISDKVPKSVQLTDKIIVHGLEEPAEQWADTLLNPRLDKKEKNNLWEYDIKNSVKKLERIYINKCYEE